MYQLKGWNENLETISPYITLNCKNMIVYCTFQNFVKTNPQLFEIRITLTTNKRKEQTLSLPAAPQGNTGPGSISNKQRSQIATICSPVRSPFCRNATTSLSLSIYSTKEPIGHLHWYAWNTSHSLKYTWIPNTKHIILYIRKTTS